MQNLHDLPVRRGTLLLVKNWLEEHNEAIRREYRSAKQYEQFLFDFLYLLMTDSTAMYKLIEGTLEIWIKNDKTIHTGKRPKNGVIPPLEGQIDIEEVLRDGSAHKQENVQEEAHISQQGVGRSRQKAEKQ